MAEPQGEVKGRPSMADLDFDHAPFIVFWEVTRACALACIHCRAEAQPRRHPLELTTEEGFQLFDRLAEMGNPIVVLSGGDPLMRQDLFDLLEYGIGKGLRVSLSPSATKLVTLKRLQRVKEAGLGRISFSLDGSCAEVHDSFRQTKGSFDLTMQCFEYARQAGLPFQINTTVTRRNLHDLDAMVEAVTRLSPTLWDIFFLVPTGRALAQDIISSQEHEDLFNWIYDLSQKVPFDMKTTEAQHYRRLVIQRKRQEAGLSPDWDDSPGSMQVTSLGFNYSDGIGRASKGVNDGNGVCFVSHIGDVFPSGYLPIAGGNVRQSHIADIYRNAPIFRDLRDKSKLKGKCGPCEFSLLCGGSRSRAYAVTGDYLESEPFCIYVPKVLRQRVASR